MIKNKREIKINTYISVYLCVKISLIEDMDNCLLLFIFPHKFMFISCNINLKQQNISNKTYNEETIKPIVELFFSTLYISFTNLSIASDGKQTGITKPSSPLTFLKGM